jgi:hypothetical protein
METRTFETGPAPKIKFENVSGSLRVRARETESVEIQSGEGFKAEAKNGDLTVACESDCTVLVPLEAGGDLRLAVPVEATDIPGGCEIQLGEGKAERE